MKSYLNVKIISNIIQLSFIKNKKINLIYNLLNVFIQL